MGWRHITGSVDATVRRLIASFLAFALLPLAAGAVESLTVLTYNTDGNSVADWSTNAPQVQAIGRQMGFLQPDIVTFQEIGHTNTWQMAHFVRAFLPGYFLATNSCTDGYIQSVILSRYPIARSQSWLCHANLAGFGYAGTFTRDLFEAEITVPGFVQPVHVFTTHLKSGQDTADSTRRAAEASAISNFLVTVFLPAKGERPYLLTGDLNEDIARPPSSNPQSLQRLTSAPTGLRLTTPTNPITRSELTWSTQSGFVKRYDYILPGGLLWSNLVSSQVFRSDVLVNPPPLQAGQVSYDDGSPATIEQYSKDVAAFLMWAAEPHMMDRKALGFRVILFLIILSALILLCLLMATNISIKAAAVFTGMARKSSRDFR